VDTFALLYSSRKAALLDQVLTLDMLLLLLQLDNTAKVLVDELSELMCKLIDTFDARGLANAAWAFGKLKYVPNQKLPAQIAAASVGKVRQFSAQNLSNMLWSFVYLHYRNEELLQAAAEQVGGAGCVPEGVWIYERFLVL
jgi:hypothetical protein